MKKAFLFFGLILFSIFASAKDPTFLIASPGDSAKFLIYNENAFDAVSLKQYINSTISYNRLACTAYGSYVGYCKLYLDFPLESWGAYGTLRVYGGISSVSVNHVVDYKGLHWVEFTAFGYAKPAQASSGTSYSKPNLTNNSWNYWSYYPRNSQSTYSTYIRYYSYPYSYYSYWQTGYGQSYRYYTYTR